jgi:hypothetical protein
MQSQILQHVQEQQRIGEHRQREIMAAQAQRRQPDQERRRSAQHSGDGNAEPGRDVPPHQAQRHRVGADAEERGVAERNQSDIAREQVPRQAHHRP